jgi:uncharacterized protein with HEPN domain
MSKRSIEALIADIYEAIEKIERYTTGISKTGFMADDKTIDAVVRNLEIIGEAANRLPDRITKSQSIIQWKKIIGLRNRIVHDYFGIDVELVWRIIQNDLPIFRNKLISLEL